jgi:tRNA (guanine-N7-)-methyltransferase
MRLHSKHNGSQLPLLLDLSIDLPEPLDFAETFGNDYPVEVEIGCGKGTFLNARARIHPEINFLGIDRVWRFLKLGVGRAEKQKLSNIRFIRMDARWVVSHFLPEGGVDIFHIYYPDPWPKPRDQKHRLLDRSFLLDLNICLRSGGRIELATDDYGYYIAIQEILAGSAGRWNRIRKRPDQPFLETRRRTNYEEKYLADGRQRYYLELVK